MNTIQTDLIFDPELIRKFDEWAALHSPPRRTASSRPSTRLPQCDWLGKRAIGGMANRSLYFHIPFCNTICYYCACNKIITKDHGRSAKYLATSEKRGGSAGGACL